MATLKNIPREQITIETKPFSDNINIITITARWKTWFGWSADMLMGDYESIKAYKESDRCDAAVERAIEDLHRRVNITFRQLAELVE